MEHTISHRELRNKSAEVLRGVAEGDSYLVTNHGVPAARVTAPHDQGRAAGELVFSRPATDRAVFGRLRRVTIDRSTAEILDDLRDDR